MMTIEQLEAELARLWEAQRELTKQIIETIDESEQPPIGG